MAVFYTNRCHTPKSPGVDENGIPICPGGNKMVYNGFCKDRCRIKWKCPRLAKKANPCDACASCSPSAYGRVIYTKPSWDPRLFTNIPRGTEQWKAKMRERTAAERVNDRIMQDYRLEFTRVRSKKRLFFYITAAAMNMHLDAQLKFMAANGSFDFFILLGIGCLLAA